MGSERAVDSSLQHASADAKLLFGWMGHLLDRVSLRGFVGDTPLAVDPQRETGPRKPVREWQFVGSGNITREEIVQVQLRIRSVLMHSLFGRRANGGALRIEASLLRIFLIHCAHHVVEAGSVVGRVANHNDPDRGRATGPCCNTKC